MFSKMKIRSEIHTCILGTLRVTVDFVSWGRYILPTYMSIIRQILDLKILPAILLIMMNKLGRIRFIMGSCDVTASGEVDLYFQP